MLLGCAGSLLAGAWHSPLAGTGDAFHSAFQPPSAANRPKHGLSWDLSPFIDKIILFHTFTLFLPA